VYRFIVKQMVRRAYRHLSAGDHEAVLARFGPESVFVFSGTHAFGGERRGVEAIRALFRQMFTLFPGLTLHARTIIVNGWPWDTRVAVHFDVRATLPDGRPYENQGMQFLRLRFGRVVEDRLYEDTQKLGAAIESASRPRSREAAGAHA
jgi:ketosteroid isomerase-like protein